MRKAGPAVRVRPAEAALTVTAWHGLRVLGAQRSFRPGTTVGEGALRRLQVHVALHLECKHARAWQTWPLRATSCLRQSGSCPLNRHLLWLVQGLIVPCCACLRWRVPLHATPPCLARPMVHCS